MSQPQATRVPPPSRTAAAAAAAAAPEIWKALPEDPSRFRLGEEGMPWTPWTWPMGHEPGAYPQEDEEGSSMHSRVYDAADAYCPDSAYSVNPTSGSVVSPLSSSSAPARPQAREDPERVRELETLSAALMTVDNGFENQWWNQGPRLSTVQPPP